MAASSGAIARPALVVLAAGESARLKTCKALVRLRADEPATPLALLLDAALPVFPGEPLIVSGPDPEAIAAAAPPGVEVVRNPRWSEGRTGSIQVAARARAGRDLCLAQVDTPLVERAVFAALFTAWLEAGSPGRGWLAPWVRTGGERRFGHPVLLGRALAQELAGFAPDRPLRDLRGAARPLLAIEVQSSAILDDLDRPEDLERLRERLARAPGKGHPRAPDPRAGGSIGG